MKSSIIKLGIKQKIIFLTTSLSILLVLVVIGTNIISKEATLDSVSRDKLAEFNDVFWAQVNSDANAMEKILTILAMDDRLVDTFLSGDKEALLQLAKPKFESLKTKFDITHFYFINTSGAVFLRTHNPPKYGDVLKRATFLQAQKTGDFGKGIEMGKKFFSLRVVKPIKRNGQVVGYFELGEELDHLITSFKKVTKADISMWVSADYAQKKNLTSVFEKVNNWYRVMSSDAAQQDALLSQVAGMLNSNSNTFFTSKSADSSLVANTFPFKDAFGQKAGVILIANDTSKQVEDFNQFLFKIIAGSLFFLLIVVLVAMQLAKNITMPLERANKMLLDISKGDGDLTRKLEINSKDEVGELANNFNHFVDVLHKTMTQVSASATNVTTSSEALSMTAQTAEDIVTRQNNETDQLATAINEMTATIQEVANNAHDAAEAAEKADKEAEAGKSIVLNTIGEINVMANDIQSSASVLAKLKDESENIGSVLDVIKGIAEQTNLLALNAAIEAARAGEQGRGFAVVADEVRTLAQRTQESTQEIEMMIETLQRGTNEAEGSISHTSEIAQKTASEASHAGESLETITQAVVTIKNMNTMIATAAEEQTSVANEINQNVHNIQSISAENVDSVTEIANSSTKLADQGVELETIVSKFKL